VTRSEQDLIDDTSPLPVNHIQDGVYISGYRATEYAPRLRAAGITNVLKLYEDIPYFPTDFVTFENPLNDGEPVAPEALRRGTDFILNCVLEEEAVLVMCVAGISRSATFVLSYLLRRGHDLRDAYRLLKAGRPQASPHPKLWLSLIAHYQLKYTLEDVISWDRG
jgi:protein-tyrosine phosphatase